MSTESIILISTQILTAIGYFISVQFQSKKIETLQSAVTTQKDLLNAQGSEIDNYKKLINLSDVEKNLQLKIDNLHLEYKKIIELRDLEVSNAAIKSASKTFQAENHKMIRAWSELVNINAQFIMSRYPDKENTDTRDDFITKFLPFNAEYIIPLINAWNYGQLEEFKTHHSSGEFFSSDNTQEEK